MGTILANTGEMGCRRETLEVVGPLGDVAVVHVMGREGLSHGRNGRVQKDMPADRCEAGGHRRALGISKKMAPETLSLPRC